MSRKGVIPSRSYSVYSYQSSCLLHQALLQCDRHYSFRQHRLKFDQRTTGTDTRATEALHLELGTNTTPNLVEQTKGQTPKSPVVTQTEYDQNSGRNEKKATLKTVRTAFTVRGLQRPTRHQ